MTGRGFSCSILIVSLVLLHTGPFSYFLNLLSAKSDHLNFGDCHIAKSYQETFTMTNLSGSDVLRFEWPPDSAQVCFSPRVGHLHTGCAKDVTVTFCSTQPVTLNAQLQKCKLCRIVFQQPVDQVADWDDRQRTVKWVDSTKQTGNQKKEPARKKVRHYTQKQKQKQKQSKKKKKPSANRPRRGLEMFFFFYSKPIDPYTLIYTPRITPILSHDHYEIYMVRLLKLDY